MKKKKINNKIIKKKLAACRKGQTNKRVKMKCLNVEIDWTSSWGNIE